MKLLQVFRTVYLRSNEAATVRRAPQPVEGERSESGYLLMGLVTILSIVGIASGVAVQEWSIIEAREREKDLIFIQEQYAAAIFSYQEDQGALPVDLEMLNKPGGKGQRYLRRPYVDPLIRGAEVEDWCLLKASAAGRIVSSCAQDGGNPDNLGLGSDFQLGEKSSTPNANKQQLTPGGIVGVHSKSTDKAFNQVVRKEKTYNRWFYTIEDFRKEVAAVAIPGVTQTGISDQDGIPGMNNNNPAQPDMGGQTPQGNR